MYPQDELKRLALYKAELVQRIGLRRAACVAAAAHLAKPLSWLDRAQAFWRSFSSLTRLAALPLGLLVQRTLFPRVRVIGILLRWAPPLVALLRGWWARTTP